MFDFSFGLIMKFQVLSVLAISLALAGCASSPSSKQEETVSVAPVVVHSKTVYVRDESVALYAPSIGGAAIRAEDKAQVLWNAHYTDSGLKQTDDIETCCTLTHVFEEMNKNRYGASVDLIKLLADKTPEGAKALQLKQSTSETITTKAPVKPESQSEKDTRLVNDAKAHLAKQGKSLQSGKDRSFYVKKAKPLDRIRHLRVKPTVKEAVQPKAQ